VTAGRDRVPATVRDNPVRDNDAVGHNDQGDDEGNLTR